MTVIVTGFDPFHGAPFNPSGAVAERVSGASTHVLPTSYMRAQETIEQLIDAHTPSLLLMLGLHEGTELPLLERFAVNIDDSATPDNDGEIRQGTSIDRTGPAAFRSGLDLQNLQESLYTAGFEAGVSNHAGAFVCNHTYYCALKVAGPSTECLFIHIPPADPDDTEALDTMARMVETLMIL